MATMKAGSKRKRSRKARTDVSSPSSSEAEETRLHHTETGDKTDDTSNTIASASDPAENIDEQQADSEQVFTKRNVDSEKAFEEFYLRQAAKEFANDLDKLRTASDFRDKSISMLVEALKQGSVCFSSDEKARIVRNAAAA